MEELVIRRFKEEDADEVYDLINLSLESLLLQKVYDKDVLDVWHSLYNKKYVIYCGKVKHFYVAVLDNKIVACGAIHEDRNMGYLSMIYTNPKVQGKGLGRKMMETLENDEIAKEKKKIFLHAAISANLFYQKMGYHYATNPPEIIVDTNIDVIELIKEL